MNTKIKEQHTCRLCTKIKEAAKPIAQPPVDMDFSWMLEIEPMFDDTGEWPPIGSGILVRR